MIIVGTNVSRGNMIKSHVVDASLISKITWILVFFFQSIKCLVYFDDNISDELVGRR